MLPFCIVYLLIVLCFPQNYKENPQVRLERERERVQYEAKIGFTECRPTQAAGVRALTKPNLTQPTYGLYILYTGKNNFLKC